MYSSRSTFRRDWISSSGRQHKAVAVADDFVGTEQLHQSLLKCHQRLMRCVTEPPCGIAKLLAKLRRCLPDVASVQLAPLKLAADHPLASDQLLLVRDEGMVHVPLLPLALPALPLLAGLLDRLPVSIRTQQSSPRVYPTSFRQMSVYPVVACIIKLTFVKVNQNGWYN